MTYTVSSGTLNPTQLNSTQTLCMRALINMQHHSVSISHFITLLDDSVVAAAAAVADKTMVFRCF